MKRDDHELLAAYADGVAALDGDERRRVEELIARDGAARAELDAPRARLSRSTPARSAAASCRRVTWAGSTTSTTPASIAPSISWSARRRDARARDRARHRARRRRRCAARPRSGPRPRRGEPARAD